MGEEGDAHVPLESGPLCVMASAMVFALFASVSADVLACIIPAMPHMSC